MAGSVEANQCYRRSDKGSKRRLGNWLKVLKTICISLKIVVALFTLSAVPALATVQVFEEPGFPSADTAPISNAALRSLLPDATFADARALPDALNAENTSLLVMPYGSAFPESAWAALRNYLDRGHDLLVLGGRPFTRAAYQENGVWKLRDY